MTKKITLSSVWHSTENFGEIEYRPIYYAIQWFNEKRENILIKNVKKENDRIAIIKLKGKKKEINNLLLNFTILQGKHFNIK